MLSEAVEALNLKAGDIVFDGTLGGGGHTEMICENFGNEVKIIGIDRDPLALERTAERLASKKCDLVTVCGDFREIKKIATGQRLQKVSAILLDLGLSSNQLENSGRGFSFRLDEPLQMTFGLARDTETLTARDIVNTWSEETLADIIFAYADERYAKRIAREIVAARNHTPITMTGELVAIIAEAVPSVYRHGKTHFATKTFQALRMAVNDELNALEQCLRDGLSLLKPEGRIAVITFHSVEDRLVKNLFKEFVGSGRAKLIVKKPKIPTEAEIEINPRARSAKLRILEKIA